MDIYGFGKKGAWACGIWMDTEGYESGDTNGGLLSARGDDTSSTCLRSYG